MAVLSIYKVAIMSKLKFRAFADESPYSKSCDSNWGFYFSDTWNVFSFILESLSCNDSYVMLDGGNADTYIFTPEAWNVAKYVIRKTKIWENCILFEERYFAAKLFDWAKPLVVRTFNKFSSIESNGLYWFDEDSFKDIQQLLEAFSQDWEIVEVDPEVADVSEYESEVIDGKFFGQLFGDKSSTYSTESEGVSREVLPEIISEESESDTNSEEGIVESYKEDNVELTEESGEEDKDSEEEVSEGEEVTERGEVTEVEETADEEGSEVEAEVEAEVEESLGDTSDEDDGIDWEELTQSMNENREENKGEQSTVNSDETVSESESEEVVEDNSKGYSGSDEDDDEDEGTGFMDEDEELEGSTGNLSFEEGELDK